MIFYGWTENRKTSNNKGRGHHMSGDNPTIGTNSLIIFHQNICGLQKKVDELINSILPDLPHIICMDGYRLATPYCRKSKEKGRVCIFVHKNLNFLKADLSRYCN
jgi:hypothetical protein